MLNTGGFNHPTHDFFLLEFLQQNTDVEYKVEALKCDLKAERQKSIDSRGQMISAQDETTKVILAKQEAHTEHIAEVKGLKEKIDELELFYNSYECSLTNQHTKIQRRDDEIERLRCAEVQRRVRVLV